MNFINKSFALLLFVSLIFPVSLFSQTFENFDKSVLVDIPGDNYDFDLLTDDLLFPYGESYITWLNKSDSVYTIYLKKISPATIDSNIIISSNNIIKSNPQIALNSSGPGLSIFWENFNGNFYQIAGRNYYDDSLSNQVIIKDSLGDDPQITTNYNQLAWITDSSLFVKQLYPDTSSTVLIDTEAGSPSLVTNPAWSSPTPLLYEKSVNGNLMIYLAEFNSYPDPHWEYFELSDGYNPGIGSGSGISFERVENGFSRIKYNVYCSPELNFLTSENNTCNYKNPDAFSYPVPTEQPDEDTPFFVVFDTDSIENNNEVMLKTIYTWPADFLFNISNMEGDDYNPKADVMLYEDIPYVVIVWIHQEGGHSTLWMAKTIFSPAGGVKEDVLDPGSFDLQQNYPNPFNPATNIEYSLKHGTDVKVEVFDILGNNIRTLVNEYEAAGNHKVIFDGTNLSSGVYFYSIEVNGLRKTRSMVLLR